MRRSAFLHISGAALEHFNALRRADSLPFHVRSAPEKQAKWQEFSLSDAFSLAVMLEAMGAVGSTAYSGRTSPEIARYVVGNQLPGRNPAEFIGGAEPIFVGAAEIISAADDGMRYLRHFELPLSALPEWQAQIRLEGDTVARLLMANASAVAIGVLARATEIGVAVE